jgi:hypothetical protein
VYVLLIIVYHLLPFLVAIVFSVLRFTACYLCIYMHILFIKSGYIVNSWVYVWYVVIVY